ncbi:uncharacterized protein LOC125523695 [Triticum urartu]|uniref:uncharacterized protein LOC125523695 n=1 Tax=Triticum urartu TaxID=4572 RepID=UPI002044761D|nr:uncharacterized protein LOC125523695 [Triticum urartu]
MAMDGCHEPLLLTYKGTPTPHRNLSPSHLSPSRPLLLLRPDRSASAPPTSPSSAATVISGVREHVQEVRRGRIRPLRGPPQAGTVRVLAIEPFSAADVTNSSSLPLLRAASDLLTSSTRTGTPRSMPPL